MIETNLVTYKIKYNCLKTDKNIILNYMKKYNNLLKCTYNYIFKNKQVTTKQIWDFQKSLNNVITECGLKNGSIYDAKALMERNKENKICFGGKKLFTDYQNKLITKEELNIKRLSPINSIGEAIQTGNRHFKLIDINHIIFHPTKNIKINLNLENYKNRAKDIEKLIELQNTKQIPITYKLDLDYVYITFDLNKVREINSYKPVENRVFGIDLNPNYIGYSIVDWKDEKKYKIIDSAVISIKDLNDYDNSLKGKGLSSQSKERKYITNKRNYEIIKIVQNLVNTAKHYHCEIVTIEDLTIKSSDKERGKSYNRLCNNQWNRHKLYEQIQKYCKLNNIKIIKIDPAFSSFIGNLVFRKEQLFDACLSSIEIGRRGYEFNLQYIKKTKNKKKNIIFPELHVVKDRIEHALEVLNYSEKYENLKELYYLLKNRKLKYRFPLENYKEVFRLFSQKSFINLYNF